MISKPNITFECDNCKKTENVEFEIREGGLELPEGWGLIGWDVHTAKHACSEECWSVVYDSERDLLKVKSNPYTKEEKPVEDEEAK